MNKHKIQNIKHIFLLSYSASTTLSVSLNKVINLISSLGRKITTNNIKMKYMNKFRNVEIVNTDTGILIKLNAQGVKSTLEHGNNDAKLATVEYLDKLLTNSKFLNTEPDTKGRAIEWTYLKDNVIIDGTPKTVVIDIKKDINSNDYYFYTHAIKNELTTDGILTPDFINSFNNNIAQGNTTVNNSNMQQEQNNIHAILNQNNQGNINIPVNQNVQNFTVEKVNQLVKKLGKTTAIKILKEAYKNKYKNVVINNCEIGNIVIGANGIKNAFNHNVYDAKLAILENLSAVLADATIKNIETDTKGRDNLWAYLTNEVNIDGVIKEFVADIKMSKNSNNYYNHNVNEKTGNILETSGKSISGVTQDISPVINNNIAQGNIPVNNSNM